MLVAYLLAFACVVGLSVGQLFFQRAASSLDKASTVTLFTSMLSSGWLWCAIILYGCMTLLWVYVLSKLPLQYAYPVYGFSFLLVPLLSGIFLNQPIAWQTLAGGALIFCGVLICASAKLA